MRRTIAALFLLLMAAPSAIAGQAIPGANTPFDPLTQQLSGIEFIKAQIADLRRELSRCDGSGARGAGACASRALLQAKLNWLLEVSTTLGDPDTAGAPPTALTRPSEASDYERELSYLQGQITQERGGVYLMSENRAKYWVIVHCKAVNDLSPLRLAYMTPEEAKDIGGPKTRAAVVACINEYDVKAIVANRKEAFEHCMQSTLDPNGGRALLNLCMLKHDMLTAMCKQDFEMVEWWSRHKTPAQKHAWPQCPLDRLLTSAQENQAVMAAPAVRTMPQLPPTFFAPPDVVIPPRPPLPIPAGTVIEVRIQGSWDGLAIDRLANDGSIISSIMDKPLVVNGTEILPMYSGVVLKGRVIGSSAIGARPATVQIGLTTDEVSVRSEATYADLKSNELVFTVPYRGNANNPGILFDTRLRFTIGGSGSVDVSSTQTPASPAPRPQVPAGPVPTGTPTQAEDQRQRANRVQACILEAMKLPVGAQAQAIVACAQVK